MTATERLRAMLDERGVEWEDFDGEPTWAGGDGRMHYARQEFTFAGLTDEVTVYHLTPAQAIDATLGRGTCHDEGDPSDFCCSECGVRMFTNTSDTYTMIAADEHTIIKHPNYCPNCGRRCVG